MAKRFTDSEKFSRPWYRKLSPEMKCLWELMISQCDAAGVWTPDFELASFLIGTTIDEKTAIESMGQQVEILNSGKWWIVDFIPFQYGTLSPDCYPHRKVIDLITKHGLKKSTLLRGYTQGTSTLQEEEEDTYKEEEEEEEKEKRGSAEGEKQRRRCVCTKAQAEAIYGAYPRKVGRAKAISKILDAARRLADRGVDDPVSYLLDAVRAYAASPAGQRASPDYRPHPATWFNQGRFDDDRDEWRHPNGGDRNGKPAADARSLARINVDDGRYDRKTMRISCR